MTNRCQGVRDDSMTAGMSYAEKTLVPLVDPKETLTLLLSATGERLGSASAIRRLQPFRHLHDSSGCFRLERWASRICTD